MKRIAAILIALVLLTGCGEKHEYYPVQTDAVEYTAGDIELCVTGRGLTGETENIVVEVINNSEGNIVHGVPGGIGGLEIFMDGQWCYRVKADHKNVSTTSALYFIKPGESSKKTLEVGILEPGLYRIRACFWLEDMKTVRDRQYYLEYEFAIE